jgi:hypothetical protein
MIDGKEISLELAGIGIVFHSPMSTKHIVEGSDYLTSHFTTEHQV